MQLKPTVLKFILGFLDVLSSGVESTEGSVVTGSIDIESEASAGVSVVLGSIDSEFMGPEGVDVGSLDVVVWAGEIDSAGVSPVSIADSAGLIFATPNVFFCWPMAGFKRFFRSHNLIYVVLFTLETGNRHRMDGWMDGFFRVQKACEVWVFAPLAPPYFPASLSP